MRTILAFIAVSVIVSKACMIFGAEEFDPVKFKKESKATEKLYRAIKSNNLKKAQEALKEGADIDSCPLGELLLPLQKAAQLCLPEMCTLLLQQSANPNACGPTQTSPLHFVADSTDKTISPEKRLRTAEVLLNNGADPTQKECGISPLETARSNQELKRADNTALIALFELNKKKSRQSWRKMIGKK